MDFKHAAQHSSIMLLWILTEKEIECNRRSFGLGKVAVGLRAASDSEPHLGGKLPNRSNEEAGFMHRYSR